MGSWLHQVCRSRVSLVQVIVVPRITSPNNFFTNIVSLTRSSRLEFDITTKSACGKWIVREAAQPFWRRQGLGEHLVHYLEHWVVFVGKRFWSCRIGSPISFLFSTKTGEIRQWNRKLMVFVMICFWLFAMIHGLLQVVVKIYGTPNHKVNKHCQGGFQKYQQYFCFYSKVDLT